MYRFFSLAVLILFSCGDKNSKVGDTPSSTLAEDLVGEWRNTSLKVTMNSANGVPDSVFVITADATNWDEVVHLKPIRTFFEENRTYHSDHYALNDSLLFSAIGTWSISNDTLVMKQTSPNVATYRLKTKITDDEVTFSGKLDFDEDGAEDDDYFGVQKKFSAN